ncbi:hypothetical protein GXP70_13660 [Paenibacillus lycopersici]|uniref:Uncharacterized protein n=1 Tax=Paenibacillus lycopersici TaxID=2704462 RepID=A0A6C0FXV7_9BACL|nr:hypothetical protein [Paenibacillus lycopersici]QHT60892.1 hypothetical protein GXP70_13660 [Paenibacillus lycopersici]
MKAALDQELEPLRFSDRARAQVLRSTHPRGLSGKLLALWNKELEIPVVPVTAAVAVLAGMLFFGRLRGVPSEERPDSAVQRVLVVEGSNVYWQDEYEKAVASIGLEQSAENTR